jgi:two-component system, NtrC family, response regulator AtoC
MTENTVETPRVLVVSREMSLLRPLWSLSESNSWYLETAASAWEAIERVQADIAPHLLVLDPARGDGDSLHILRWLGRVRPDLSVLMVCHPENSNRSKEAMRLGAKEILVRPFNEKQLETAIRNHLDASNRPADAIISSDNVESVGEDEFFISASPVMQKLRAQADLLAQADVPVLIVGEPGSGKGTVARLIHKFSVHSGFDFVRVNCAEMPGELLETELFGKASGSSNSGRNGREGPPQGKLCAGGKGTLLLEEITEMPLSVQMRLLHILQSNQSGSPSEERPVETEIRILVSSSAKLDLALAEKRFHEDLYYRLSAFTIHVPALRQRKEEIKALLQYSMHKLARHYGLTPREFTDPVLESCLKHSWPGNLRELEAFVKRYLIAGDKELIFGVPEGKYRSSNGSCQTLRTTTSVPQQLDASSQDAASKSLKSLIQNVKSEAERNAIAVALEKTGWNRKAAARLLKISYRTVLYKIDQYHISPSEPHDPSFSAGLLVGRGSGKTV